MKVRLIKKTESAHSQQLLIKQLLKAPLARGTKAEIVYRDRFRYGYPEFAERVRKLASALEGIGVQAGQTVAVLDWDSHRYLECYFAIPCMGAVLHTVNIRLSPEQVLYTMNHAEAEVVIVHEDFLPMLEEIKGQLETVKKFVLIREGDAEPSTSLPFAGEYEDLLAKSLPTEEFPDLDENSMATVFYTTGTTGLPKGVYYSHRQIVLHTYGFMTALCAYDTHAQIDSGDVYMPLTPMFHVHAWGMPYIFTMLGNKQVYPGRYESKMVLKLAKEEGVTFSHCVPTIVRMLLDDPSMKGFDWGGWKILVGGAALPVRLCVEANEYGIELFAAYGMSETCPLLTVSHIKPELLGEDQEKQLEIRCRTGLVAPNVELQIVGSDGSFVKQGSDEAGEIVARAPWLTTGYLKDPERSEELWRGGWLHTGDVGYRDEEDYLHITDRIKDVIKTGGEWVSSLELEEVLTAHSAVKEAAVIGVPDDKWGERPIVIAVLRNGHCALTVTEELVEFYRQSHQRGEIPKYAIPDRIEIVDEIEKTSVGKVNKKLLRQRFAPEFCSDINT